MSSIHIRLDQLSIRLRGVSRMVAEAALDGMGEELGRHLARLPVSTLPTGDVFRIRLDGADMADPRDVTALREAIAQQIVAGLTNDRARAASGEEAP
ncbi:MAG: hypothetical protein AAGI13_00905 [Pseudomonadota bacterium]